MKIGPKYKIARRLGSSVFDKTQTQKFMLRQGARGRTDSRPRSRSEFALQLLEKQKARYGYGVNERQFSRYAKESIKRSGTHAQESLFRRLELRLDNVVYRMRLAPTRQAARQMVAHGHVLVNGRRIKVPSHTLSTGDVVSVRLGSRGKALFSSLKDEKTGARAPSWISLEAGGLEGRVSSVPLYVQTELPFDVEAILDFYRR